MLLSERVRKVQEAVWGREFVMPSSSGVRSDLTLGAVALAQFMTPGTDHAGERSKTGGS
jgi:hypothetical protein